MNWTHACCGDCWFTVFWEKAREGPPCRVLNSEPHACCFCKKQTAAGIFIRHDPKTTPCKGACRT